MIAAYARNGRGDEALSFFAGIDHPGARSEATFVSALDACADLTALGSGAAIHAQIASGAGSNSTPLTNALIHMYGKCGSLDRAIAVFQKMWLHNEISWSSMISALDQNGESARAVAMLPIISLEGALANEITFTAILTACSHLGMIEPAFQCFVSLGQDYGVEHRMEHYSCIVDLLGRSGWLPEAEELILAMPYEPDPMTVASLLGACKLQGDAQCGGRAVRRHHKHMATSGPLVLASELAIDVSPRNCTRCTA
ncbi:hypothetical protein SELMODRAFT_118251 [Selaginella moellendorffii]|uniref:Pentacotripeptide-repeat region of PRORP domain-containing protein n=2 Tax=Selaginella moellendorffii TaxID=88036 RepID=D8SJS7_SELML|nr:hypothetical protein SELMODRAFT_118251 [Selaginella moellendorffii]